MKPNPVALVTGSSSGLGNSLCIQLEVVVRCVMDAEPPIRIQNSPWTEEFARLKAAADPDGKELHKFIIEKVMS